MFFCGIEVWFFIIVEVEWWVRWLGRFCMYGIGLVIFLMFFIGYILSDIVFIVKVKF